MEKRYDSDSAKIALLKHIENQHNPNDEERLYSFKSERYKIHQNISPSIFKLIKKSTGSSDLEEATFTAYGIILEKELPPVQPNSNFLHNEKSKRRYATFIRQYVAITGLNLEAFNKTLEGLGKVHRIFQDALPNYKMEPLEPFTIHENLTMACYTRYFHSYRHCKSAIPYPFGPGVDPDGVLEQLSGDSYVHTEDNAVQYLGKKVDEEKYFNIDPVRFQKGDIVEVTVSFGCVRTRSGSLKILTSLKALTMIDDKFREKAREDQVRDLLSQPTKTANLHVKRRFVEIEDDENLVEKYARMDMQ